jgi:hypothetical protein
MIIPRKRMNNKLFSGAPTGTLKQISETGYLNSELFLEWLNHFVAHVKPSSDDPVLLIVDSHPSCCSPAAVLFCKDHHITLLTLPPHAIHKLQPLDKGFFGPLKTAYASDVEKCLVNHPGQGVTLFHVSGLFRAAYSKMATVAKAEKTFAATGIFPFNPDATIEDEFASSYVTARNPDVVHQLPKMPDSWTADAKATGEHLSAFKVVIMAHHFCHQRQE